MSTSNAPADPTIDPDLKPPEPRRVVGELLEEVPEEHQDPEVTELTDEERSSFVSLLTCGRHSKKITVMGHSVVIHTLKTGDEMRVGLFTKKYLESQMGFQRAYQVAVCAAGIREIQGQPLFRSLREVTDEDEIFDKNVEAVMELYPIVVTQIYQAIMDLEREYAQLAIKLGKLSG
ncbi:tail assembly chaperone [Mycobacterium phage Tonenili]|uniref:Tail assembly chaperone n=1 Tax=Mycobacterium phage Tonenili TaxID=1891703 RepID=A0A1C9EHC7_9CAUD|nr:tail assembly chaperone [Mycobacterium phage Tonenili]AON96891.1 tail assembly chaperone [Mycobacterium phage Tonenili]